MKQQLRILITQALESLNLPLNNPIEVDHPQDESHGDYATNIAMVLYPQIKEQGRGEYHNPRELAQAIADQMQRSAEPSNQPSIQSFSVAGPGFINITLSPAAYLEPLNQILQSKGVYGHHQTLKAEKIVVEYTDPNPFKEFHIGHLYSNAVGECLARLHEAMGATVYRADYFGDVGLHVAKAMWALLQKVKEGSSLEELAHQSITKRQHFLGSCYAHGSKAYADDPKAKDQIDILNTHLYPVAQKMHQLEGWEPKIDYTPYVQSSDAYDPNKLLELYTLGRSWSLEYFETLYSRLGTKFDGYYPESKAAEIGYQFVKDNRENGIFEESQGAIIYKGEHLGLHTRVFINKNGLPTYEAKELGLAPTKYLDFPYTKSIIVTGNEINEYFKVLIAALTEINPRLGQVTTHIGHGMVKLPEGKMSSRTGNVVTGDSLMDQAKSEALSIINQLNPTLEDKEATADAIGVAAIKYAFLKSSIGSDIIFNLKEALSFTGNSGPYLQYTHARCYSVLQKSETEISTIEPSSHLALNPEELSLLRYLPRYPQVVEAAAAEFAPHHICTYVYELSRRYNTFYNRHSILGSTKQPVDSQTTQFRLALTQATAHIIKNSLHLLGIKALKSM